MLSLKTQERVKNLKRIVRWPIDEVWRKNFPPRFRGYARLAAGLLLVVGILFSFLPPDDQSLKVYFFDIGQGDATLIKKGDFDILIDGGPDARIIQKLGIVLPFYDREIEIMLLTHPHADHLVGQIEVLRRYNVRKVLYTGVVHTTDEYLAWLAEIRKQGVPMEIVKAGAKYEIQENAAKIDRDKASGALEILHPFEDLSGQRISGEAQEKGGLNDTSIVAKLVYGNTSFLFTGDAGIEVEKQLLSSQSCIDNNEKCELMTNHLRSDVLKVGHHGSKYSTSKEFLEAVKPGYAVIQVGKNRYGHPAFKVLWNLKEAGARVFRNDKDGDVVFESDGADIKIKVNRESHFANTRE